MAVRAMTNRSRLVITLLALLGLSAASASTWVHYQLVQDATYASFCDVSATVSCTSAYQSAYGAMFGVPVAILGALWFVGVLALLGIDRWSASARDNVPGYLFAWATIGLSVILYLAYGAFVVLKTVCLMCVLTYIAVIGVFFVAGAATRFPMTTLPSRLFRDLRTALASPAALTAFLLLIAGAGSVIAFFPRESSRPLSSGLTVTPEPTQELASSAVGQAERVVPGFVEAGQLASGTGALTEAQRKEVQQWYDAQQSAIVPVDGGGAAVVVVKFNDYQCPPCKQTWEDYTPILKKFEKQRPGLVKYVMKDFPLEPECNGNVAQQVHPAACEAAAAMRMAKARGADKADALEAWIFSNQATVTPMGVRNAARDIAGVTDFDAKFAGTIESIKADTALGGLLQVKSTPTFFINGKRIQGGVPPIYFEAIIEYALKKAGK